MTQMPTNHLPAITCQWLKLCKDTEFELQQKATDIHQDLPQSDIGIFSAAHRTVLARLDSTQAGCHPSYRSHHQDLPRCTPTSLGCEHSRQVTMKQC